MLETVSNENNINNKVAHDIKIKINSLLKDCKNNDIPIFISYFVPGQGYVYNGLFPEEIQSDNVQSEYWRFMKFLEICVGFNKEDYKPIIRKN